MSYESALYVSAVSVTSRRQAELENSEVGGQMRVGDAVITGTRRDAFFPRLAHPTPITIPPTCLPAPGPVQ